MQNRTITLTEKQITDLMIGKSVIVLDCVINPPESEKNTFLKWKWMADWCKDNRLSPYEKTNWDNAEKAYNEL